MIADLDGFAGVGECVSEAFSAEVRDGPVRVVHRVTRVQFDSLEQQHCTELVIFSTPPPGPLDYFS